MPGQHVVHVTPRTFETNTAVGILASRFAWLSLQHHMQATSMSKSVWQPLPCSALLQHTHGLVKARACVVVGGRGLGS